MQRRELGCLELLDPITVCLNEMNSMILPEVNTQTHTHKHANILQNFLEIFQSKFCMSNFSDAEPTQRAHIVFTVENKTLLFKCIVTILLLANMFIRFLHLLMCPVVFPSLKTTKTEEKKCLRKLVKIRSKVTNVSRTVFEDGSRCG